MTSISEKDRRNAAGTDKAALAAVIATGGAVVACAACCVLPIALPAIALGGAGAVLVVAGAAYRVLTIAGAVAVLFAWAWVALQSRRTGKKPARPTLGWLSAATGLAVVAAMWPRMEPVVRHLIG